MDITTFLNIDMHKSIDMTSTDKRGQGQAMSMTHFKNFVWRIE